MNETKNYLRTDLALEGKTGAESGALPGGAFFETERNGVRVTRVELRDDDTAGRLQKERGTYVTLSFGKPWLLSEEERAAVVDELSNALRSLLPERLKNNGNDGCVLVVGLGNRRMTADAVGPLTVEKITVTAHLPALDPALFNKLGQRPTAAFVPGVLGDTGMESAETVGAVVKTLAPDAVIVIDALAARSVERLTATVQLCDSGIRPGSGVGNNRPAFNRQTLGCPVVAVGVPTVVDSSTLVCDALEQAGITAIPEPLRSVLENGKSFFVSLKEADAALEALSSILAEGIDSALSLNATP